MTHSELIIERIVHPKDKCAPAGLAFVTLAKWLYEEITGLQAGEREDSSGWCAIAGAAHAH